MVSLLACWACDWSIVSTETLLREHSHGQLTLMTSGSFRWPCKINKHCLSVCHSRAAVKLSSVDRSAVTKGLGTAALVYIFQALNVDIKDCLGHPHRSQCVDREKYDLSFWTCFKLLVNYWYKAILKLWWFHERSHTSTNRNIHFLVLEKVTTFVWYPTIVAEKLGDLNKWRLFGAPYLTATPQTLGLYPPLCQSTKKI